MVLSLHFSAIIGNLYVDLWEFRLAFEALRRHGAGFVLLVLYQLGQAKLSLLPVLVVLLSDLFLLKCTKKDKIDVTLLK